MSNECLIHHVTLNGDGECEMCLEEMTEEKAYDINEAAVTGN